VTNQQRTAPSSSAPAAAWSLEPCPHRLERNLTLLSSRSPRAVEAIRAAPEATHTRFEAARLGGLTGQIEFAGVWRRLASAVDPLTEGQRFARAADVTSCAAMVVRGFGLGHHVGALASRLKRHGAVIVYEPDARLLRAVFERVDCTSWLLWQNTVILTECDNAGATAQSVMGLEGVLAAGVQILDHAPSRMRLEGGERFAHTLTDIVRAVRTNIVTTLVQVETTVRNNIQNLKWYSTCPGIADLAGAAAGAPAVVVAAGPSLNDALDTLAAPGVRDRVVIIAVQTVLKTLLSRGIRPHFVTALDYHEISRRFYEGLSPADVEGVTLVVEPKASPAILEAFPGNIRCVGEDTADRILGQALWRDMGRIDPGATVAHMAYYLARHLGCDPVLLVGQDLGFTGGHYYGSGAAIHNVWAGELSEFNTLEMLEWQRIARMRSLLRRVEGADGRPIYTDEQMATYLLQFERDFLRDREKGLRVIDTTPGGVRKRHTEQMPLAQALDTLATRPLEPLPAPHARDDSPARRRAVEARVIFLRDEAHRLADKSTKAADLLGRMLTSHENQGRVNALISKVQTIGEQAAATGAYWLAQFINQTGQFKRYRADRLIALDEAITDLERQRRQIDRDIENVTWMGDAARDVARLLDDGLATLRGGVPITRDPSAEAHLTAADISVRPARRIAACILVDEHTGGLGQRRDLARPWADGRTLLSHTLSRLASVQGLTAGVLLLSDNPARAMQLAAPFHPSLTIHAAQIDGQHLRDRARAVGRARLWSRHAWRGGLANLSIFDEAYAPRLLAPLLEIHNLDAAMLVHADWALLDPALAQRVLDRSNERPDAHLLTFTQAAPGLSPCVLARSIIDESARVGGPFATIGGLLGYIPVAPQADPIVKPVCPSIDTALRDCLARLIPDSAARFDQLRSGAGTTDHARWVSTLADQDRCPSPEVAHITASQWRSPAALVQCLSHLWDGLIPTDAAVTIDARGDTDPHHTAELIHACRQAGLLGVHVRTELRGGDGEARTLLAADPCVISVDLHALTHETHETITGRSTLAQTIAGVELLAQASQPQAHGLPDRWVVPRITRRTQTLEEIEPFYDRWLLTTGACVIDPPDQDACTPAVRALPLPAPAAARRQRAIVCLHPSPEAMAEPRILNPAREAAA
jgi:hypothetical protein